MNTFLGDDNVAAVAIAAPLEEGRTTEGVEPWLLRQARSRRKHPEIDKKSTINQKKCRFRLSCSPTLGPSSAETCWSTTHYACQWTGRNVLCFYQIKATTAQGAPPNLTHHDLEDAAGGAGSGTKPT